MMPSLHPFKSHEKLMLIEKLNTVMLVLFGNDAVNDAVTTWRETHNAPCEILGVSGLRTFFHGSSPVIQGLISSPLIHSQKILHDLSRWFFLCAYIVFKAR
jgi:hypothetical protein